MRSPGSSLFSALAVILTTVRLCANEPPRQQPVMPQSIVTAPARQVVHWYAAGTQESNSPPPVAEPPPTAPQGTEALPQPTEAPRYVQPLANGGCFDAGPGGWDYGYRSVDTYERIDVTIKPNFGFAFLRPRWSNDYFQGFGNPETLDYGLEFVPELQVKFAFPTTAESGQQTSNDFIIEGRQVKFTGNSTQKTTAGDTSTDFALSNSITINSVDLAFVPIKGEAPTFALVGTPRITRPEGYAGIALRYLGLEQDYASSARSGDEVTELEATQSVGGFGLGGYAGFKSAQTLTTNSRYKFGYYGTFRGTVLYGNNERESTFRGPGETAVTTTILESEFIPVGEAELGITLEQVEADSARRINFRLSLYGTAWGNVAPVSAAPTAPTTRDGNFFMAGAMVWIEVILGPKPGGPKDGDPDPEYIY